MTPAATARKRKPVTEPEVIQAELINTRFRNEDSGFTIANFGADNQVFAAKGPVPSVRAGETYRLTGRWHEDPKWGRQFVIDEAVIIIPETIDGAVRYLASTVSGVGQVMAHKIVQALGGSGAIQTIIDEPDRLMCLPFIKESVKAEIIEAVMGNQILAQLCSLICRDGIGPATATRIHEKYGTRAVDVVKANPYVICDDVAGIGFKKADMIASALGIAWDDPYRIEAAYKYMLQEATEDGDCFLRPNDTIPRMFSLLGREASIQQIAAACQSLQDKEAIVRQGEDRGMIFLSHVALWEEVLAQQIGLHLLQVSRFPAQASLDQLIDKVQGSITLETLQRQAIATALAKTISIITGGPGTGKSTVLKAICDIWTMMRPADEIYLAAPTGKAAKRIEESTGRQAQTIHRLLGYRPGIGFTTESLRGLLIVDEVSMMDVELACALSRCFTDDLTVVFVGDADQLPSVGPGKVLADMIAAGVPTTRLKYNYRQAQGSMIAAYATLVNEGVMPPCPGADADYVCFGAGTPEEALTCLLAAVDRALADGYDSYYIQVLTPMRRASLGTKNLNELLRPKLNPNARPEDPSVPRWKCGDVTYYLGDKVIQTRNNYDLGVFNGDTGKVTDFDQNTLTVDFDGWTYVYDREAAFDLQLAYALTIHKSQGSEFPVVIMPIMSQAWIMLQRTLLYTGMTRAKNKLILITNEKCLRQAVSCVSQEQRKTYLCQRIQKQMR